MKIEVNDETLDDIVASVILEAIQGTHGMCMRLMDNTELEPYEMKDLAQGLRDLKALIPAYKFFSPVSEHFKLNKYEI